MFKAIREKQLICFHFESYTSTNFFFFFKYLKEHAIVIDNRNMFYLPIYISKILD